jgi:hypothetical protein
MNFLIITCCVASTTGLSAAPIGIYQATTDIGEIDSGARLSFSLSKFNSAKYAYRAARNQTDKTHHTMTPVPTRRNFLKSASFLPLAAVTGDSFSAASAAFASIAP